MLRVHDLGAAIASADLSILYVIADTVIARTGMLICYSSGPVNTNDDLLLADTVKT